MQEIVAPLEFFRNPSCNLCPLCDGPITVCLPTTPLKSGPIHPDRPALLIVGEAPGYHEDVQGVPFVGPVGQHLRRVYIAPRTINPILWDLAEEADVYLTNAVRCQPENNDTPNLGPIRKCHKYLQNDLRALRRRYPRVVILAVGATAVRSLFDMSQTKGFKVQPRFYNLEGEDFPVYMTYHPGVLLPGREPAKADAVVEHLQLLRRDLQGRRPSVISHASIAVHRAPILPLAHQWDGKELVLDIETYGILDFMPAQRYMHPAKSAAFDHITTGAMIPLVGIAWSNWDFGYFYPGNSKDLVALNDWLDVLQHNHGTLIGANITFDLTYLRYCYPKLAGISPDLPVKDLVRLEDTQVWNYLHNSMRPERSLKALLSLFGLAQYPKEVYDGLVRSPSLDDPQFLRYSALDCIGTWHLRNYLKSLIAEEFGPDTDKLKPYATDWYSNLLWLVTRMSEAGVAEDRSALKAVGAAHEATCERLMRTVMEEYGGIIEGPGSGTFANRAVETAARAAGLLSDGHRDRRLTMSSKAKKLSTDKKNTSLIISKLPPDSSHRRLLEGMRTHRRARKILGTYVRPRLRTEPDPKAKPDRTDKGAPVWIAGTPYGIAYPDWFAVPSLVGRGDHDDTGGGTLQCRITCRRPALQTDPPELKSCLTCRFSPGVLFNADLSQIEFRLLALMSGDPIMIQAFRDGVDFHQLTADLLFDGSGSADLTPDEKRQVGKKVGFLRVYGGGPAVLQETLLREAGLDFPLARCQALIRETDRKFPVFAEWRDRTIAECDDAGFVDIPLVGASRATPAASGVHREPYAKVVINFKAQAGAACVLISAQAQVDQEIQEKGLRALTGSQVYDSIQAEAPAEEADAVESILDRALTRPPYWQDLCCHYRRNLPLAYDLKKTTRDAAGDAPD